MGRLSEYINGYRGRHSVYGMYSPRYNTRTGSLNKGGDNGGTDVQIFGVDVNLKMLGSLMTNDPIFNRNLHKYVKQVLREARRNLTKDAKAYMKSDPRKAAMAVKHSVYKTIIGGNISILQKGKGHAGARYELHRHRKLDENPRQRGGNRRERYSERNRLDTYYGTDRGFILRFISSGTVLRTSRYGDRGVMRHTNWFGHTAPWQMQTAAVKLADAINEYIKQETNG